MPVGVGDLEPLAVRGLTDFGIMRYDGGCGVEKKELRWLWASRICTDSFIENYAEDRLAIGGGSEGGKRGVGVALRHCRLRRQDWSNMAV
jgi:hypothetical protein